MKQSLARLSAASYTALAEAALILQHAKGFVFLPLLVPSERAGVLAMERLRPALKRDPFRISWPAPTGYIATESVAQKQTLADLAAVLQSLDEATHRLPHGSALLLDASSSTRAAVAQQLPVFLNQRREDWRAKRLLVLVLWPQALRESLLQGAPDLWSMRAAAPWLEESFDEQAQTSNTYLDFLPKQSNPSPLSPAQERQWQALQQGQSWADADVSPGDLLALIDALLQQGRSYDGLSLAEQSLTAHETAQLSEAWWASLNFKLALLRLRVGNRQGALAPAREAVAIYRSLAQANPAAYEPDLAASLNNLANYLSETGKREDALVHMQEAVVIYRRLAKANPAAYEPDLAMSLNNLASLLSETGDRHGALSPAQEALAIRRRLARANPAAYEPDLATSLNNLAIRLSETGDRQAALAHAQEAVSIRRRLAQANPAAYEADLAGSLNNLANHLSETGDRQGTLNLAQEAVAIYRRLAQATPAAYEPDLATSLNNLANFLSETGERQGALTHAQEAVAIRRRLAQANPAAYEPDLAMSLGTLMLCHAKAGQFDQAREAGEEALERFTRLATQEPARFEPYRKGVEAELSRLNGL